MCSSKVLAPGYKKSCFSGSRLKTRGHSVSVGMGSQRPRKPNRGDTAGEVHTANVAARPKPPPRAEVSRSRVRFLYEREGAGDITEAHTANVPARPMAAPRAEVSRSLVRVPYEREVRRRNNRGGAANVARGPTGPA